MILIIGLGNPGKKFKRTRHNLGFSILDQFKKEQGFSKWENRKEFKAKISKGIIGEKKIVLAKPQTFMNESGKAAKLLITHYKLPVTNLLLVHDDLDIPLGKIKISKGRGSAGHKGVQSIIDELKTKDFVRFRIGIKPQKEIYRGPTPIISERFVLQKFGREEQKNIKQIKKRTSRALELAIKEGFKKVMSRFNR